MPRATPASLSSQPAYKIISAGQVNTIVMVHKESSAAWFPFRPGRWRLRNGYLGPVREARFSPESCFSVAGSFLAPRRNWKETGASASPRQSRSFLSCHFCNTHHHVAPDRPIATHDYVCTPGCEKQ
ncbi:hypothetical protein BDW22DRAFT_736279 [Trametopsis cervina]|nr:hypothetical protein BDW22DRAFT_736279 [Trametopsis cervina]